MVPRAQRPLHFLFGLRPSKTCATLLNARQSQNIRRAAGRDHIALSKTPPFISLAQWGLSQFRGHSPTRSSSSRLRRSHLLRPTQSNTTERHVRTHHSQCQGASPPETIGAAHKSNNSISTRILACRQAAWLSQNLTLSDLRPTMPTSFRASHLPTRAKPGSSVLANSSNGQRTYLAMTKSLPSGRSA